MSKKPVKKAPPVLPKKWHPSAAECAASFFRFEESGGKPRVYDRDLSDYRDMTPGEITKGRRYLAREVQRKAYEAELREHKREEAEREARLEEREARKARMAADAKKLSSAREAMAHMMLHREA